MINICRPLHIYTQENGHIKPLPSNDRASINSRINSRVNKIALSALTIGMVCLGIKSRSMSLGSIALLSASLLAKVNALPLLPRPKVITSIDQLQKCDLSEVEEIDLSDIPFLTLPKDFNPPKLKILNLNGTGILSLPDGFNPPKLEQLYLSSSHIRYFPDDFNPPKLKELYLGRSYITHLPSRFNPLNLEALYLSRTCITSLPDNFNPPKLKELQLSYSQIEYLPEHFNPPNLKELNIGHTPVHFLPSKFNPPKLETFQMHSSQVSFLPNNFNPPVLETINLSSTPITRLPNKFNPPKLKNLALDGSRLLELSDNFSPPELTHLNLSWTQITSLPDKFYFPNLTKLELNNTRISSLPEKVHLPQLKELNLNNTLIASLPSEFHAPNLKELHLNRVPILSLPENFNPENLELLDISNSLITSLPDNFNPPKLRKLTLFWVGMPSFPDHFNPPNLREIQASNSGLLSLPDKFNPPNLERLDLHNTPISSLPAGFNPPNLKRLCLSRTQISSIPDEFCPPILESLDLVMCSLLFRLPESILNFPQRCTIRLSLSNFPNAVQRRLRAAVAREHYTGPQFDFNEPANRIHLNTRTPAEAMQLLLSQAKDSSNAHYLLSQLTQDAYSPNNTVRNIHIWLDKIFLSASAESENKEAFFKSIIENLKIVSVDAELRSFFQDLIDGTTTTCGDGITLSTLQLSNQVKVKMMDISDSKAVYKFLVHTVYAMDILHKTADNIIPTLVVTDPIEVYLGLPLKLKDEFEIGINIDDMLFYGCSNLRTEHIDQARDILKDALGNQDKIMDFLIDQPKWIEVIKDKFSQKYAAIEKQKFDGADDPEKADQAQSTYRKALKELSEQLV